MSNSMNPDIAEERANCKLDLKELTESFWNGNDRRKYIGLIHIFSTFWVKIYKIYKGDSISYVQNCTIMLIYKF